MDAPDSGLSPTPVETPTMDAVPAFFFQYFCTAFLRPVYKYRFFGFAILGERIRGFFWGHSNGSILSLSQHSSTIILFTSFNAKNCATFNHPRLVQIEKCTTSENHIAFILILIIGMSVVALHK